MFCAFNSSEYKLLNPGSIYIRVNYDQ